MQQIPWSADALAADLRALGLGAGEVLMVHASLRAIGPVAGGADGVIDAIRLVLGAEGTMLMVLGSRDDMAWVNARPEAERAALLQGSEPFDAQRTPADPEVGVLAEVFRERPDTRVSDHPEGRFGAAGPLAAVLLEDVPWDDYFGPGSPLERLIETRGRVLRLGADANTMTVLHHAEYRCSVTPKRRLRRHRLVAGPTGPTVRVIDSLDDDEGIVDYAGDDYFSDILRDYLAAGRARRGRVGDAASELIAATDFVDFGVRWMDRRLVAPDDVSADDDPSVPDDPDGTAHPSADDDPSVVVHPSADDDPSPVAHPSAVDAQRPPPPGS